MATRQREPISPRWPSVATSASLPNVAGSPTQSSYLQVGDECYVSGDGELYVCVVATLGAAAWRAQVGIADGAITGAKIVQSGTLDIGATSITTTGNVTAALLKSGAGSPEGVTTAGVGAIYRDTTNGLIYVKRSGSGNTGWRALADLAATDPLSVFPSYGLARGLWNGAGCADYLDAVTANLVGIFGRAVSGAGAGSSPVPGESNSPGIHRYTTGTDTTGRASTYVHTEALDPTSGVLIWRGRFRVPTASDGTNTFAVTAGFIFSITDPTGGGRAACFRYTHSTNSGRLVAACRLGGSEAGSTFNTTIDPVITTGFIDLEIKLDQPNNTVTFVRNGSVLTTMSTNVPNLPIGAGVSIIKSAGTTARTFDIDAQGIWQGGLSR